MTILDEITQSRQQDLPLMHAAIEELNASGDNLPPRTRTHLSEVLARARRVGIIAELKPASPSQGVLLAETEQSLASTAGLDYSQILAPTVSEIDQKVSAMVHGRAIGVSVLTEPRYFHGSYGNLQAVARVAPHSIPILLKDFIVDEVQLELGQLCGASNALIVASIGNPCKMVELAAEYELEPLIEIHSEDDISKVAELAGGEIPFVIGINNRDLTDLTINFQTTWRLVPRVREVFGSTQSIITESGISSRKDLMLLGGNGVQAALVGTAIMHSRIDQILKELQGATPLFIKICGITDAETFHSLDNPSVTAFGCVVGVPESKRNVDVESAQALFEASPAQLIKVLVTKDKSLEEILDLDQELHPDLIQYHGENAIEYLPQYPPEILSKAILPMLIEDKPLSEIFEQINALPGEIFAILLDSSQGTGRELNLPVASRVVEKCAGKRVILAGRISTTNITEIANAIHPFGVDLSSSLEINGRKNDQLISQFLETARSLNSVQIE